MVLLLEDLSRAEEEADAMRGETALEVSAGRDLTRAMRAAIVQAVG